MIKNFLLLLLILTGLAIAITGIVDLIRDGFRH